MIQKKKKKKKKKKKQREKNECFFDDDASKERSATTRTPQTNWRTSSFIDEMMRKDLCDTKFSASLLSVFFLTVTLECGVLISSLEHFFLSDCFWQFFLFRAKAFLSSETNCSRFVSFVSRKRKKFRLLSFEDHQFGSLQENNDSLR